MKINYYTGRSKTQQRQDHHEQERDKSRPAIVVYGDLPRIDSIVAKYSPLFEIWSPLMPSDETDRLRRLADCVDAVKPTVIFFEATLEELTSLIQYHTPTATGVQLATTTSNGTDARYLNLDVEKFVGRHATA